MGDTAINVPIDVRTHEVAQLQSFVPTAKDKLESVATKDNNLADEASQLDRIYDEHISGSNEEYVSMPADDWRAVVRNLGRIDGLRAWWLRTKITGRLRERLGEME